MDAIVEEQLAAGWRHWLAAHGLDDFDAWWRLPFDGVDRANRDGRGWSVVSAFETEHVFARPAGDAWEVRFIDLENTRRHFGRTAAKLADLESLSRHARHWSRTDKLRVLLAYLGKARVDASAREAVERIRARTRAKHARWRRRRPAG